MTGRRRVFSGWRDARDAIEGAWDIPPTTVAQLLFMLLVSTLIGVLLCNGNSNIDTTFVLVIKILV